MRPQERPRALVWMTCRPLTSTNAARPGASSINRMFENLRTGTRAEHSALAPTRQQPTRQQPYAPHPFLISPCHALKAQEGEEGAASAPAACRTAASVLPPAHAPSPTPLPTDPVPRSLLTLHPCAVLVPATSTDPPSDDAPWGKELSRALLPRAVSCTHSACTHRRKRASERWRCGASYLKSTW